jgi:DNA-directed RNA polymerase subunit RPC12/RpoP
MFKCKECGRTILILGRLSVEKKPMVTTFATENIRTVIDSPCCPYCGSKEFEEVKEHE